MIENEPYDKSKIVPQKIDLKTKRKKKSTYAISVEAELAKRKKYLNPDSKIFNNTWMEYADFKKIPEFKTNCIFNF